MQDHSMRFSVYDKQVLVTGLFNGVESMTARVMRVFPISRFREFVQLEIIPLYCISSDKGIFRKRHLSNYFNVHMLIVPCDIGEKMTKLLKQTNKRTFLLITFNNQYMSVKNIQFNNNRIIKYHTMVPGVSLVVALTTSYIFHAKQEIFYSPENEYIPLGMPRPVIRNIVFVSELRWCMCELNANLKDQLLNAGTNSRCLDYTNGDSVLEKKIIDNIKRHANKEYRPYIPASREQPGPSKPTISQKPGDEENIIPKKEIIKEDNELQIIFDANIKKENLVSKTKQVVTQQAPPTPEELSEIIEQETILTSLLDVEDIKETTMVSNTKQVVTQQAPPTPEELSEIIEQETIVTSLLDVEDIKETTMVSNTKQVVTQQAPPTPEELSEIIEQETIVTNLLDVEDIKETTMVSNTKQVMTEQAPQTTLKPPEIKRPLIIWGEAVDNRYGPPMWEDK